MRSFLAALAALLCLPLAVHAAPEDWERELDGEVIVGTDDDFHFVGRVVDYRTGEPIAGARVELFSEVQHPTPGFGTPIAVGRAGADGWVRIPRTKGAKPHYAAWAYFSAGGYAPDAVYQSFDGVIIELRRPRDVPIVFRDPLDRPIENLGVSLLLGCGHTPDVRITKTDARGRAVLRGVQMESFGQVWLWREGILSEYGPFMTWRPGWPPFVHRCKWSPVVTGTVLTHEGKPAAGVAVGMRNFHRGPWARADDKGRFRLLGSGLVPGDDVFVETFEGPVTKDGVTPDVIYPVPPPGFRAVIRLPAPSEEWREEPRTATIVATAVIEGMDTPPEGLSLEALAVRESDGWTVTPSHDEGAHTFSVPPGQYTVIAYVLGDTDYPGLSQARVRAAVAKDESKAVSVTVPAPRSLRLRSGPVDRETALFWVTETFEGVVPLERKGGVWRAWLPAEGPVSLRLEQDDSVRIVPLAASAFAADAAPLEVPWVKSTTICARLVGPDGKPVAGWLQVAHSEDHLDTGEHRGVALSEVWAKVLPDRWGTAFIQPQPSHLADIRIPLPSPLPEGEIIDLGVVTFSPWKSPSLTVRGPDGKPAAGARVRVDGAGHTLEVETDEQGVLAPGLLQDGILVAGAEICVHFHRRGHAFATRSPHRLPLRALLRGPGPYEVRSPGGRLTVRAVDEGGAKLDDFTVLLDGHASEADKDAKVEFLGITAGTHHVTVTSEGRRARLYRVEFGEDESRTIECTLRATADREKP